MSVLDILFIILLSSGILSLVFSLVSFLFAGKNAKQYRRLSSKKIKNKRRKKQLKRKLYLLKKKKNGQRNRGIFLIIFTLMLIAGSFYSRYYQLTTLDQRDNEAIVQSYMLVDTIQTDLNKIQDGASSEKVKEKLKSMVAMLASYGTNRASDGLRKDSQKMLNRYFSSILEFANNLDKTTSEQLKHTQVTADYLEDIEKIQQLQKKIFKEFSLNEEALKKKR